VAIAFGIFAIIFAFLACMSVGSGGPNDAKAAPYCFAAAVLMVAASTAWAVWVH